MSGVARRPAIVRGRIAAQGVHEEERHEGDAEQDGDGLHEADARDPREPHDATVAAASRRGTAASSSRV